MIRRKVCMQLFVYISKQVLIRLIQTSIFRNGIKTQTGGDKKNMQLYYTL